MATHSTAARRLGYNERLRQEQQRSTRRQRSAKVAGWFMRTGWKYLLAVTLTVLGAWQGWYWVRRLNPGQMLTLKSVEVTGNQLMGWDEILQIAGVEVGMPMSLIETDSIAARLQRQSRVRLAEVSRSFPSTLVIQLQEATALYLCQKPRGWKVFSEKGTELPIVAVSTLPLPIVNAESAASMRVATDFLRELREQDSLLFAQVSQVVPAANLLYVEVYMRNASHKVYFTASAGRAEDFRHYRLLAQGMPVQLGNVKIVDMRYRGFAYTIPYQKGQDDG